MVFPASIDEVGSGDDLEDWADEWWRLSAAGSMVNEEMVREGGTSSSVIECGGDGFGDSPDSCEIFGRGDWYLVGGLSQGRFVSMLPSSVV